MLHVPLLIIFFPLNCITKSKPMNKSIGAIFAKTKLFFLTKSVSVSFQVDSWKGPSAVYVMTHRWLSSMIHSVINLECVICSKIVLSIFDTSSRFIIQHIWVRESHQFYWQLFWPIFIQETTDAKWNHKRKFSFYFRIMLHPRRYTCKFNVQEVELWCWRSSSKFLKVDFKQLLKSKFGSLFRVSHD